MIGFNEFLLEFSPNDLSNYSEKLTSEQLLEKIIGQEFSAWLFYEDDKIKTLYCTDHQRHKELVDSYLENILEDYEFKDNLSNKEKQHIKEINEIFEKRGYAFYNYMFKRKGLRIGCNKYSDNKTLFFQIDYSPKEIDNSFKSFIIKALEKWPDKYNSTLDYFDDKLRFVSGKDKIYKLLGRQESSGNKLGAYGQFIKDHPYNRFDEAKLSQDLHNYSETLTIPQLLNKLTFGQEFTKCSAWLFYEDDKIKTLYCTDHLKHKELCTIYLKNILKNYELKDELTNNDKEHIKEINKVFNRKGQAFYNYMFKRNGLRIISSPISMVSNSKQTLNLQIDYDISKIKNEIKNFIIDILNNWTNDNSIFEFLGNKVEGKEEVLHTINPSYKKKYVSPMAQFRESINDSITEDEFFKDFNQSKTFSGWIWLENDNIKILKANQFDIHYFLAKDYIRQNYSEQQIKDLNLDLLDPHAIDYFMMSVLKAVRFGLFISSSGKKEIFIEFDRYNKNLKLSNKIKDFFLKLITDWQYSISLELPKARTTDKQEILSFFNNKKYISPLAQFREQYEEYQVVKMSREAAKQEIFANDNKDYSGWIFEENGKIQVIGDSESEIHLQLANLFLKQYYNETDNNFKYVDNYMFNKLKAVRFGKRKDNNILFFEVPRLCVISKNIKDYMFELISDWDKNILLDLNHNTISINNKEDTLKELNPSYNKKYISPLAQFRESTGAEQFHNGIDIIEPNAFIKDIQSLVGHNSCAWVFNRDNKIKIILSDYERGQDHKSLAHAYINEEIKKKNNIEFKIMFALYNDDVYDFMFNYLGAARIGTNDYDNQLFFEYDIPISSKLSNSIKMAFPNFDFSKLEEQLNNPKEVRSSSILSKLVKLDRSEVIKYLSNYKFTSIKKIDSNIKEYLFKLAENWKYEIVVNNIVDKEDALKALNPSYTKKEKLGVYGTFKRDYSHLKESKEEIEKLNINQFLQLFNHKKTTQFSGIFYNDSAIITYKKMAHLDLLLYILEEPKFKVYKDKLLKKYKLESLNSFDLDELSNKAFDKLYYDVYQFLYKELKGIRFGIISDELFIEYEKASNKLKTDVSKMVEGWTGKLSMSNSENNYYDKEVILKILTSDNDNTEIKRTSFSDFYKNYQADKSLGYNESKEL